MHVDEALAVDVGKKMWHRDRLSVHLWRLRVRAKVRVRVRVRVRARDLEVESRAQHQSGHPRSSLIHSSALGRWMMPYLHNSG